VIGQQEATSTEAQSKPALLPCLHRSTDATLLPLLLRVLLYMCRAAVAAISCIIICLRPPAFHGDSRTAGLGCISQQLQEENGGKAENCVWPAAAVLYACSYVMYIAFTAFMVVGVWGCDFES
jgi:hypothetical protein